MTQLSDAEIAAMVARLRQMSDAASRASKILSANKTARNHAAGEEDALYCGIEREQTTEWKAADLIEALAAAKAQRDDGWRTAPDMHHCHLCEGCGHIWWHMNVATWSRAERDAEHCCPKCGCGPYCSGFNTKRDALRTKEQRKGKAMLAAAPAPPAQGEDIATLRARLAQAEELAMAAKFTEEVINRWRETGLPSVPKFMVAQDKLRAALTAWNGSAVDTGTRLAAR